jgi:hypothetical protein
MRRFFRTATTSLIITFMAIPLALLSATAASAAGSGSCYATLSGIAATSTSESVSAVTAAVSCTGTGTGYADELLILPDWAGSGGQVYAIQTTTSTSGNVAGTWSCTVTGSTYTTCGAVQEQVYQASSKTTAGSCWLGPCLNTTLAPGLWALYSSTWHLETGTYVFINSSFGTAAPCNVTSQSGFYSATADGIKSFDYTYTYTGAATVVVGAPKDTTTATITNNGKTFPADSTITTGPPAGTTVETVTPAPGGDPNATEFWCYTAITGWVDWGNAYSSGSGQAPSSLPCILKSLSGPQYFKGGIDQAYTFTFYAPAPVPSTTQVAIISPTDPTFSTAPPDYHPTYTVNAVTKNYVFLDSSVSNVVVIDIDATTAPSTWYPTTAEAWCYDGPTGIINNPTPGTQASNGSGIIDCSQFPALSLGWSIGTDLGNIAHWGVCAVQWLVVPTSWSAIMPNLTGKPPFVWVADMTGSVATMYTGLTSGLTSNKCDAPKVQPFHTFTTGIFYTNSTIHNFTVQLPAPTSVGCTSSFSNDNAGEIFGARVWLRDIELFGLLFAFIATVWRLLPWSDNADADIIDAFGAVHTNWKGTATFYVKEGSDD